MLTMYLCSVDLLLSFILFFVFFVIFCLIFVSSSIFFYPSVFFSYVFSFFFFKQKTAYEMRISDWSSDVCSSDLGYPREVYPCRAADVAGIGQQRLAAEMAGEDAFACPAGFFLAHPAKAESFKGFWRALDDEGRGSGIEPVGMRPDPPMFCLFENEVESVEEPVRAQIGSASCRERVCQYV